MVHRRLELRTPWLKIKCSTYWANGPYEIVANVWLGWQDLNLRMPESKSGALTTRRHPNIFGRKWGGQRESNSRPPGPQSGALTNWAMPAIFFGAPEEIRTPDTRLRRPLLYPTELQARKYAQSWIVERVMGIGPTRPAWKAGILPLNYTRMLHTPPPYWQRLYIIALLKRIVKYFSRLFAKFSKNFLIIFLSWKNYQKNVNISPKVFFWKYLIFYIQNTCAYVIIVL